MKNSFGKVVGLLCLLQLVFLLFLYQPLPRILDTDAVDTLYNTLFASNTILLVVLAYLAFRQHRVVIGLLTALLAFPGLLFWSTVLAGLVANRRAE